MDERELDCAIDAAAGAMMAREPGRAVSYNVMARVRADAAPAPRPIGWIAAAAGVVVCAATAVALMTPAPAPVVSSTPSARSDVVGQPPAVTAPPMTIARETAPTRRASAPIARRIVLPAELPPHDVSSIEPIEAEPIALAAIDVPELEREATTIETLDIEPLTIEPLAASND